MELQYELNLDDYVIFNKYHIRHSPTCRRAYRVNLIGAIVAGLLMAIVIGASFGTPGQTLLSVVILVPVCWLLWHIIYRVSVARRIRKLLSEGENRGPVGPHALGIHREGVRETGRMGASEQRWAGIERIVDDKEHLYVYVSAVSAIIIPKRAFRDEEHIRAFLDEMARLRLAASGSLAPMPPA